MIYLNDLLQATSGTIHTQAPITEFKSFAFDSRQLSPGELFLAVRTPTGDGHDYINDALSRGATGILCESTHHLGNLNGQATAIVVPNIRQALMEYAAYILQKYQPQVVGVTGSSGKTTTKEAIAAVLKQRFEVFKNFGSYNGRYGLPIALGDLSSRCEVAVLEMACDSFGEIAELAELTQPKVGVVTTINKTHLAYLGTLDNIALEKGRLIEALPFDGAAILNADDPRVAGMVPRTQARIHTFGLTNGADVRATDISVMPNGLDFTLHYDGKTYPGHTNLLGRHQIYATLAAVTTGLVFNIPPQASLEAIARMPRVPGRMHPLPGQKGTLLIDDSFNASLEATTAALDTLTEMPHAHKIAILGDIPDLGDISEEGHRQIGTYAATRVERLVTMGDSGQLIAATALESGLGKHAVHVTFTADDAAAAIQDRLSPDTAILIKGGPSMRMERVVQRLLANPAQDSARLVRQGANWERVRMRQPARPTWVEIDLNAIANNVRLLAEMASPARILAVLKADAYGHGMVKVARTVLNNGATWVGVATLGEAISLRQAGIDAPILVMSYMPAWQAHEAITYNISVPVFDRDLVQAFSRAATELKHVARLHVKVDTGMGRLGVLPDEAVDFIRDIQLPNVEIEAIYTHFASADEQDLSHAREQLRRFKMVLAHLEEADLRPPMVHASNTAGLVNLPEARFDMVRPGIGLYGLPPSSATHLPNGFRPTLTFKSTVGQVKTLPPGSPIGYGGTYVTQAEETIAIIPVGYADGFRRTPRNWTEVLVKGRRAPLVGRVSMDQCAIDVSHIPNVRQGDEVVLIGKQGSEEITAQEVAANLGTINYEVVSELLARVPRVT